VGAPDRALHLIDLMDYSLDPALVSIEKTVILAVPLASLAVGM
jgi:hypothetical protein